MFEPRCQSARLRHDLEQGTGTHFVSRPHGGALVGRYGSDGRDALDHWDFWHGGIFREQAAARVGNSHGTGRAAQRSLASSISTSIPIACLWLECWTAPGYSCKPRSGFHRVPGDAARSPGVGRCCPRNGIARAASVLDSSATRFIDRSCEVAPRRVKRPLLTFCAFLPNSVKLPLGLEDRIQELPTTSRPTDTTRELKRAIIPLLA